MPGRSQTNPRRLPAATRRFAAPTPVLVVLLALLLAGCGSSSHSTGTSADPATVVPATTAIYAGADVRPEGSERSAALAVGSALSHEGDPYLRLVPLLHTPGSHPLHYRSDIAPWLGPHAGLFLPSPAEASALTPLLRHALLGVPTSESFPFAAPGARGALVLDTRDLASARAFLSSQAALAGAHATSYRGVAYEATRSGVAFGIVARFAVVGTEAGLRAVVDTSLGAPSLAHANGYATLQASAPTGAIAHLYTNPIAAPATSGGLLSLLAGSREANISLVPSSSSASLYVDAHAPAGGAGGGLLAAGAEGAQALSRLPGDSWLAVGLDHVGASLGADVSGLRELASIGAGGGGGSPSVALSLQGILEGLLTPLAALARGGPQATSWMGSGGLFASGSGLLELKGAVVIESTDAAASRAAVQRLAGLMRASGASTASASVAGTEAAVQIRVAGLPLPLVVAAGPGASGTPQFVLGLGEASVTEALRPASTLGGSQLHASAAQTLGEGIQPSLIFQAPTLVGVLEGVGLAEDPSVAKLVPLLRALTTVVGGGRQLSGEHERFKLVLGVTPG